MGEIHKKRLKDRVQNAGNSGQAMFPVADVAAVVADCDAFEGALSVSADDVGRLSSECDRLRELWRTIGCQLGHDDATMPEPTAIAAEVGEWLRTATSTGDGDPAEDTQSTDELEVANDERL